LENPKITDRIEQVNVDLKKARRTLTSINGKFTERYFNHVLSLIPEKIRREKREKLKAYDGLNNIFNLAYEMLSWEVHRALIKAKLEPYLGFLHSTQYWKPSLVCDFQELYRHLIDDFLIQYCQDLRKKDYIVKTEDMTGKKKGKRVYLNDMQTRDLMKQLNNFFESYVEVLRMRVGKRQTIETLINEEALLLAKFLRGERKIWKPRLDLIH